MSRRLTFADQPGVVVELEDGEPLVDHPDGGPLLFGCRTGICGTCLVSVEAHGELAPPDEEERELLDLLAPEDEDARLACQLRASCDLTLRSAR